MRDSFILMCGQAQNKVIKITQNEELMNHNLIELLTICAYAKFNSTSVIDMLQSCNFKRDGVMCGDCAFLQWCIGIKHVTLNKDYAPYEDCYKCKDVVVCMKSRQNSPWSNDIHTTPFDCTRRWRD